MKEFLKRILKVLGHALTVSVHERLDHTDHALDVVIDQNNRMARTQTALLQASIHMVTALNRLEADLESLKQSVAQLSGRSDEVAAGLDRTLAGVAALKQLAEAQARLIERGDAGAEEQ